MKTCLNSSTKCSVKTINPQTHLHIGNNLHNTKKNLPLAFLACANRSSKSWINRFP